MKLFELLKIILLCLLFQFSVMAEEIENRVCTKALSSETADEDEIHDDDRQDNDEGMLTCIEESLAKDVGIETAQASPKLLQQRSIVYGSLSAGPEQLSHVRARYSGLIKSVNANLGDKVKPGDLLAEVESNESLRVYRIRAPIAGTLIQRHANTGEVTLNQILFSIANFDRLWAEFRIYPSQQSQIKTGQETYIVNGGSELKGNIQHVLPVLDKPYQLARFVFDNREKGLAPGFLVEGHVVVGDFTAELAVEKEAIQTMGEQSGVFVKQGEEYHFVPLRLGRSDDRYIEVLSGLSSDQRYVNKNSYLIKADIKKSEAEDND